MKNEFFYHRGDFGVTIRTSGSSVKKLAAEVGYLIHNLYSSMYRKNPVMAQGFKEFILQAVNDARTPTWEIGELPPGGIEIVLETPGGAEYDS